MPSSHRALLTSTWPRSLSVRPAGLPESRRGGNNLFCSSPSPAGTTGSHMTLLSGSSSNGQQWPNVLPRRLLIIGELHRCESGYWCSTMLPPTASAQCHPPGGRQTRQSPGLTWSLLSRHQDTRPSHFKSDPGPSVHTHTHLHQELVRHASPYYPLDLSWSYREAESSSPTEALPRTP